MSETILLLRLEHRNILKVLELFATQLQAIRDREPPDLELLESALEYVASYQDRCHHPKEDLVYRKLHGRDPGAADTFARIERDHIELARLSQHLLFAIEDASANPGALGRLETSIEDFLDQYRRHMQLEEREFFPTALRVLSADDLAEIDFDLFDRPDPVFDHAVEEQFEGLRAAVLALARQRHRQPSEHVFMRLTEGDASWLEGLSTLSEFNAKQEALAMPYRLVHLSGSGYALLEGDTLLMDFPECSAARAAWCAYYYLRGREDAPAG